ncbi:MAG: hypothetical protein ACOY4P_18920 [Pseudomonadota bacterium]
MTLIEIAALFVERKMWIVAATDLSKDALHIYFGLALFLLVRFAWRGRGGWIAAWLAVLALACGGEALDLVVEYGAARVQPDDAHWHDIWNTMFWPTVLALVGRWLPRPDAASDQGAAPEPSGEDAERRLEQA